ncbi:MAG: hypothetical protein UU32_C0047G0008 [Candidatus Woesebacteria bacterium GW2011_GWB1_41_10]|uniref:PIN domain-containing protein n=1 Tax=Candidatus Woesebacteria bacterium GW2011_GWB1_41_10 TaxID=1618577 RepID=A0A0G0U5G2_9BACT|nr:MAG: hypothetical protein UU32_C0047G0008 [Candidatus Woesebacteria bacterium GW2011_GWB1_41_10]
MTPVYVVDASIIIAAILPDEELQESFGEYLGLFENGKISLISPEILKYEVANGLKSAFRQRRIDKNLAERLFQNFLKMGIRYVAIDYQEVLTVSLEEKDLSFYDASYVFLARANKCRFLTLDTRLSEVLQ